MGGINVTWAIHSHAIFCHCEDGIKLRWVWSWGKRLSEDTQLRILCGWVGNNYHLKMDGGNGLGKRVINILNINDSI